MGLNGALLRQMAWDAKAVKNNNPFTTRHVRLIRGGILLYSFNVENVLAGDRFPLDKSSITCKIGAEVVLSGGAAFVRTFHATIP